eukprot:scaffold444195_cov15-Prasinocladus_malaysianus.AAC.1
MLDVYKKFETSHHSSPGSLGCNFALIFCFFFAFVHHCYGVMSSFYGGLVTVTAKGLCMYVSNWVPHKQLLQQSDPEASGS